MTKDEALDLALRSLKELVPDESDYAPAIQGQRKRQEKAITAIKQARSAPVQDNSNYRLDPPGLDALYTTPPAVPAHGRELVTEAQIQTLAECEQENRLLKARVDRMQREFALERQRLLDENTEIYGLLGMAHLNLKQHLEYGFNPNTAKSTLISVGRYAPKLREAMNGWKENKPTPRQWVGLTDEEAKKAFAEHNCDISKDLAGILARAIEAKLKELNT